MGCSCYCGCATRANRLKWAAFATAAVAGLTFMAAYVGVISKCNDAQADVSDCQDIHQFTADVPGRDPCENQELELASCLAQHINAILVLYILGILCFILCSIPLYMMCCCTQPPGALEQEANQAVELSIAPSVSATATKKSQKGPRKYRGPYTGSLDAYAPLKSDPGHQQQGSIAANTADDALLDPS